MGKRTLLAVSLSVLATLSTLDAQVGSRRLTIDDIYNPTRRINFSGTPQTNITWLDPATYLTRRRANGGVDWLTVDALSLIGVYDFQRMNQIIIAYHAAVHGEVRLSPELAEYRLFTPKDVKCWSAGTGSALADWLRSRGHQPQFIDEAARA